jgi:PrtD family type I secretion system ABC transporter
MAKKFNNIRKELAEFSPAFVSIFAFSGVLTICFMIPALYLLQVNERVVASRNIYTLITLSLMLLIVVISWSLLERVRERTMDRVAYALDEKISVKVFDVINRESLRASMASRGQMLADLSTIREFFAGAMPLTLFDLMWVPLVIAIAFLMHFWLGIAILSMTLVVCVLAVLSQILARDHIRRSLILGMQSNEFGRAVLRSAEASRVMGMLPALCGRWANLRGEGYGWLDSAARRTAIAAVPLRVIQHLQHSFIIMVGALLVLASEVGVGTMFAATLLAIRTLQPVLSVSTGWRSIWNTMMAAERVELVLGEYARRTPRVGLPRPDGALVVTRAAATPQGADQLVVTDVSFAVEPGRIVGVVGASGAGKSSLGRMLVGAWPLTRGSVTLAGHEISHWDQDLLGKYIGYVPQDVEMLPGTFAENISRFAPPGPETDAKVVEAVELARIKDIVVKLPHGLNTRMGADGHQLSSGQRQRAALARALYGNPHLLVLDEPNSNLDANGEQNLALIVRALRDQGAIVVLITHRMNMLTYCDQVLVMNNGTVHAFGERDQIVNRLSAYQPPKQLPDRRGGESGPNGPIAA